MRRRGLPGIAASALAALCVLLAACSPLTTINGQQSLKIPGDKLQEALAKRFPRSYPAAGVVTLDLKEPRLRFNETQNRLGIEMPFAAGGAVLQQGATGMIDMDFGLRYEPTDMTVRARDVKVNALQIDGLPPVFKTMLGSYVTPLAERSLQDAVLHQFTTQELATTDSMGLQPGNISVSSQGLVIGFVKKTAAP